MFAFPVTGLTLKKVQHFFNKGCLLLELYIMGSMSVCITYQFNVVTFILHVTGLNVEFYTMG